MNYDRLAMAHINRHPTMTCEQLFKTFKHNMPFDIGRFYSLYESLRGSPLKPFLSHTERIRACLAKRNAKYGQITHERCTIHGG